MPSMTVAFNSIEALTQYCHQVLDRVIISHQECLIEQNLDLAQQSYELYCQLMQSHIEIENTLIFPLWLELLDTKDKTAVKWPFVIYEKEHEKLLKMLAKAQSFLDRCHDLKGQKGQRRRAILEALEYQRSLKNVAEHHEQREEQGLLPELEQALDANGGEQKKQLLDACLAIWQPAVEQAEVFLARLESELNA